MNNNDERDYAEESYNKGLLRNPDDLDISDNWSVMSESAQEVEDGYMDLSGPEWEVSPISTHGTKQNVTFVIGHTGYVTLSWQIFNNVNEEYVSAMSDKSYILPALDGSTLYVWADVHLTEEDAKRRIANNAEGLYGNPPVNFHRL